VKRGFYAELPIHVRVVGTYPEFGDFISGLAALPRIVTIHNVNISRAEGGRGPLSLEATIKTYRYLEETPQKKRGRAK
jgi:type IV pilus assembly protein PilO